MLKKVKKSAHKPTILEVIKRLRTIDMDAGSFVIAPDDKAARFCLKLVQAEDTHE